MTPVTLTLKLSVTRSNMSGGILLVLRLKFSFSISVVGGLSDRGNDIFGPYFLEDDIG